MARGANGAALASSERKRSVERSICRMLVECAYGEGGTGMEMVCSKPARTCSGAGVVVGARARVRVGVEVGVGARLGGRG